MRFGFPLISIGCCVLAQTDCLGGVTYEQQFRVTEASTMISGGERFQAFDFGPFDVDYIHPAGEYNLAQHSRLDPEQISFTGSVMGGPGPRSGGTWFQHSSISVVDIYFTVDVPTPFDAMIAASGSQIWSMDSLLQADPPGLGSPLFTGQGNFSGLLSPGRWRFRAAINATGHTAFDPDSGAEFPVPGLGEIEAILSLPSPGAAALAILALCAANRWRRVAAR